MNYNLKTKKKKKKKKKNKTNKVLKLKENTKSSFSIHNNKI